MTPGDQHAPRSKRGYKFEKWYKCSRFIINQNKVGKVNSSKTSQNKNRNMAKEFEVLSHFLYCF